MKSFQFLLFLCLIFKSITPADYSQELIKTIHEWRDNKIDKHKYFNLLKQQHPEIAKKLDTKPEPSLNIKKMPSNQLNITFTKEIYKIGQDKIDQDDISCLKEKLDNPDNSSLLFHQDLKLFCTYYDNVFNLYLYGLALKLNTDQNLDDFFVNSTIEKYDTITKEFSFYYETTTQKFTNPQILYSFTTKDHTEKI